MGRRAVPRLRHGVRVLPGAVRRHAGRDDRRLRRAHPAHDLAGRDPRARDPRQRRPLTAHPRRPGPGVGLPRGRTVRRGAHPRSARSVPGGAPGTPRCPAPRRPAAACATSCASSRHPPTSARCSASSCSRRSRPARCSPGVDYVARVLLGGGAAATVLFVCFVAPALSSPRCGSASARPRGKRTGYLWGSVLLARRSAATLLTVRIGLAAAALPSPSSASATRPARCSRSRCCPTWRLPTPPPPARTAPARTPASGPPGRRSASRSAPSCMPVCSPSVATSRRRMPLPCNPTRHRTRSRWASRSSRPCSSRSPCWSCAGTGSTRRCP